MLNATNQPIFMIFPDYGSSAVWSIAPGTDVHQSCEAQDLPFELHRRIVKKIDLLRQSYELFADWGGLPHPSITEENSFVFMVFDIYQDIKATHPEHAHLFVVHDADMDVFAQHDRAQLEAHIDPSLGARGKKVL